MHQLLLQYPDFHDARETLIGLLLQHDKRQDAVTLLYQSLEKFPDYHHYRILLSRLLTEENQWSQALSVLGDISKPETTTTLLILAAVIHQRIKSHQNAVEIYGRLIRRDPKRGDWWMGLGISLEQLAHYKEAYHAFAQAINDPRLSQQQLHFSSRKQQQLKGTF